MYVCLSLSRSYEQLEPNLLLYQRLLLYTESHLRLVFTMGYFLSFGKRKIISEGEASFYVIK